MTFAFVFARGGSRGLPGKNLRVLAGVPLLGHSIRTVQQIPQISHCFVSTDSEEIADVATHFGASVIERPIELALDDSPEWLAWRHAISWVQREHGAFDRFVSVPTTAPLRAVTDVEACLDALDEDVDVVVTMTPSHRSPWFNMVRIDQSGDVRLAVESLNGPSRRQDAPATFDLTTVAYVARPHFVMSSERIWDGRVRGVAVPAERALDIDTPLDFRIAEYLIHERLSRGDSDA